MTEQSLEQRIALIEDRNEIVDIINRYALDIDRHHWEDFSSLFADRLELNLFRTNGWVTWELPDYLARLKGVFESYTATQHLTSNLSVTLQGDEAVAWSTLNATHHLDSASGEPFQQQVGYYEWHFSRTDRWRIDRIHQYLHWKRGNQQIFERTVTTR